MSITFRCSDCTQKLRIEDEFAGKRVACVRCGSKQRVPKTSSPEFSQAAATPRKPPRPAPPALPPKEREQPQKKESQRRETEIPKPARPRPEPIWFQPIEVDEIEPPRFDLDPDQPNTILPEPEQFLPGSTLPEPIRPDPTRPEPVAVEPFEAEPIQPEPDVSAPVASEWDEPGPTLPTPTGAQQTLQHEIRPLPPVSTPRARRAASKPHAESSLVPPYQKLDVEELIDMTAMVDIVFFLLIFFLVTSMHALDSTIPMPAPDPQKKGAAREPKSVTEIDSDDSYIVVRVDRNDKISVEGSEVRTDRDLLFKLRDLRMSAAHPEKLLVVGHGDATHGTVVMVLDAGRELGMDQVRLTVQDEAD